MRERRHIFFGGVIAVVAVSVMLWAQPASAMPINTCAACYQYLPSWYCVLNGC